MNNQQYYGGLNKRFDKRARLLCRIGWQYVRLDGLPIAAFCQSRYGKTRAIPAALLHHADKRAWRDVLASNLTR